MLNRSWLEVSNRFHVQLMLRKRDIKDSRIINALNGIDWEEGHFPFHETLFDAVSSCITFDFEEPPEPSAKMMEHFEEECEYMTLFSFYIPKLAKYKDEALFQELVRELQFVTHSGYSDWIELYYLPFSNYASEQEKFFREYADQPFTFQIGAFDTGNLDPDNFVDFMEKLIAFNDYIEELIR